MPIEFLTIFETNFIIYNFFLAACSFFSEFLLLPDGGQIKLDWSDSNHNSTYLEENRPTILLLPGLTGRILSCVKAISLRRFPFPQVLVYLFKLMGVKGILYENHLVF